MKYLNAAEVLPEELIREIQKHISGNLIYVPNAVTPKKWGEKSPIFSEKPVNLKNFWIQPKKRSKVLCCN